MTYRKNLVSLLLLLCLVALPAYGQGNVWLIDIKGAIGPALADHMVEEAVNVEANCSYSRHESADISRPSAYQCSWHQRDPPAGTAGTRPARV